MTPVYETPFCIRDWNISNFPSSHIFGVGQNFETQIMAAICFSSFHPAFSSYRQISTLLSIYYTNPGATLGILGISWRDKHFFSNRTCLKYFENLIFIALAVVWLIRVVLDSRDSIILDNCQGLSYFPCTPDHHSYWWWKSWYVRKISSCEETVCMNFKNKTSVYERGWGENYQMSCSYIHWRPLYCGNEHSKEGNKFFSSLRVKVNEETAITIDHRPLFATFSLHSPPCLMSYTHHCQSSFPSKTSSW